MVTLLGFNENPSLRRLCMFVQFNFGPLIIEWLIQFSVWKKAELCINTLFVGFVVPA